MIAGRIPGRTDNEIKNYWNTHLSKKLITQGIDPRTHKPLNPSSSLNNPACSSKTINPNPTTTTTTTAPVPTIIPDQPHTNAPAGIFQTNNNPNAYFHADAHDLGAHHYQTPLSSSLLVHDYPHLPSSDSSAIANLTCTHTGLVSSDQDDEDFNYCSEDVFSSFLNSLINDDAFAAQHHLQQQQHASNPTTTAPLLSDDPLLSITSTTALTNEYAALKVSSTFNQTDPSNEIP